VIWIYRTGKRKKNSILKGICGGSWSGKKQVGGIVLQSRKIGKRKKGKEGKGGKLSIKGLGLHI